MDILTSFQFEKSELFTSTCLERKEDGEDRCNKKGVTYYYGNDDEEDEPMTEFMENLTHHDRVCLHEAAEKISCSTCAQYLISQEKNAILINMKDRRGD